MSRSHVGKIKLDISKLERRDIKLLRRLDNMKRAVGTNRMLIEALKKALVKAEKTETVAPVVSNVQ